MVLNQANINTLILQAKVYLATYGAAQYDKYIVGDKTCDCHNKVYLLSKYISMLECYEFDTPLTVSTYYYSIPDRNEPEVSTTWTLGLTAPKFDYDYTVTGTGNVFERFIEDFVAGLNASGGGYYAEILANSKFTVIIYGKTCKQETITLTLTTQIGIAEPTYVSYPATYKAGICAATAVNPCLSVDDVKTLMQKINSIIN